MKALRGSGEGMSQLREIIKSDPELLRNVVGQRFSKNPAALHDIGELEQEYVGKMPELQDLLSKHSSHMSNIEKAEGQLKSVKNIEQVKVIDKQIEKLVQASRNVKLSLKEKMKLENQLKELKQQKKSAQKKLKYGVGAAIGIYGGPPLLHKLSSMILPSGNE
jgi:hypothetical protein